ncbi:Translation initiation factor eIF-2B subunit beta like [Actinidia chinensis var. chinensis]|uniref:Translation initiation factor eIF2B subunit beta n=1 Tax=Actinidia chinensis var. chinensis TaxID=1590841 RepID=A0A2R6PW45_ACTCC|nr:Translation initiation factor eIF-2B subunit beta like [Actinidia chinensis var. chinensis]
MPGVEELVNDFFAKLENCKVEGSHATARSTAELLRSVISQQRVPSNIQAEALIEAVKVVGEKLTAANPVELAVGNVVRRVLHIIREEDLLLVTSDLGGLNLSVGSDDKDAAEMDNNHVAAAAASRNLLHRPSLHTLLGNMHNSACQNSFDADKNLRSRKLKHNIIEAVNELIEEIDTCREQIAEQAVEHIHQNEVILTLGRSRTVLEFLTAAKQKKRSFRVFVAEGAPRYQGHVLAKELVQRGVQSTLVTDSAVFAMISQVNMVIVGAHAVMANGGVIAPVGLRMVALAARNYAVPFVVVAGIHKLCPLYPHNPEILLNDMRSPSELAEFGEFSNGMDYGIGSGAPLIHVINPAFDYVPPELVSLFITDIGGHGPSYMYRLIADYYSTDDLV